MLRMHIFDRDDNFSTSQLNENFEILDDKFEQLAIKNGILQSDLNADLLRGISISIGATKLWDNKNFIIESGLWTPRIEGSAVVGTNTYSQQYGHWSRLGNEVKATGSLALLTKDPQMSGTVLIKGLPFAPTRNYDSISVGRHAYITLPEDSMLTGITLSATNSVTLSVSKSGSGFAALNTTALANNSNISFSVTYTVS